QLQSHSFAVGIGGIDYVRPVEAARPETRVSGWPVGNGVTLGSRQSGLTSRRGAWPPSPAAQVGKPIRNRLRPGERIFAQLGISRERALRPWLESADLFHLFRT